MGNKIVERSPISDRLYQDLARKLIKALSAGKFPVGSRLPAERELANQYKVSRPTVRQALIVLELRGLVEVRSGSGAYVVALPSKEDVVGFNITAFELIEARMLFEGEAAALAANQATDEDIGEIERLVNEIALKKLDPKGTEKADRAFHLTIAKATRNTAVYCTIEKLWIIRSFSPDAALLHEMADTASVKPLIEEHSAVLEAFRRRDPNAARAAMRAHLSAELDNLLFATEEKALEVARRTVDAKRARYR